ncbi:MAG: di-trans,poly-cis-decaprenylcistransferase [Gammaproteobacteria bacterium]|nr:di-trans,poly-cis-decaprenylcistransferase [Gammaproteobacteria bacterium]
MAKVDIAQQVLEHYSESIPKHIGIIMDGNGRWAKNKGMPRVYGHKKGVDSVRNAVRFCRKVGVESLTLFAFSSENWKRPEEEVSGLMDLFMYVLTKEVKNLHKNNVVLKIVGDISAFSNSIQQKVKEAQELTGDNTGLILNVAANYGGRWDIVEACKRVAEQVKNGDVSVDDITEDSFDDETAFASQQPLDLLIRTGGEVRVSNFMLWQLAYAELHFSPVYWPEFNDQELAIAIEAFAGTERRFGLTGEQVSG